TRLLAGVRAGELTFFAPAIAAVLWMRDAILTGGEHSPVHLTRCMRDRRARRCHDFDRQGRHDSAHAWHSKRDLDVIGARGDRLAEPLIRARGSLPLTASPAYRAFELPRGQRDRGRRGRCTTTAIALAVLH